MIKKEQKTIEYIRDVIVEKTCDMCGRQSRLAGGYGEWGNDDNQILDVTIRYVKGIITEDGTEKVKLFEYDVCPNCFETKIVQFVGTVPRVTEDA